MHRCLNILELLRMIFAHLGPAPSADLAALARLAITCCTFSNPALDILWHEQLSLGPLLDCLRYGPHSPDDDDDLWSEPAFLEFHSGDWDRVLFYSCRVKRITLGSTDSKVSAELLELLSTSFPSEHLLPALSHITFRSDHPAFIPHLRLFLGPKITSIDLNIDGPASRLALVPRVASKYPALTHLTIHYKDWFKGSEALRVRITSSIISALTNVRTLSVQCIDAAACRHLGSLDTLTSLSIEVSRTDLSGLTVSPRPMFASLTVLELDAINIEQCTKFFTLLSSPSLRRLRAIAGITAREDQAIALFSAISLRCSHSALTALDVDAEPYTSGTSDTPIFRAATLQPLLAFTNLSKVSFSVRKGLDIDDAFVGATAMAWPRIEELSFRCRSLDGGPTSGVTLPGLSAFARHCPALHTLKIPLSTAFPPDWDHSARPADAQATLSHLHVFDSTIEDVFPVAAFLSSVFPGLSQI
ncbi:hypothetical protein DFH09DRAFT_1001689, partial [Mycena vulgaris]